MHHQTHHNRGPYAQQLSVVSKRLCRRDGSGDWIDKRTLQPLDRRDSGYWHATCFVLLDKTDGDARGTIRRPARHAIAIAV